MEDTEGVNLIRGGEQVQTSAGQDGANSAGLQIVGTGVPPSALGNSNVDPLQENIPKPKSG